MELHTIKKHLVFCDKEGTRCKHLGGYLSAGVQVGNQFSLKIGYKLQEVKTMTDMQNKEQSAVYRPPIVRFLGLTFGGRYNVAPGFFVLNDLCFKVLCDKWKNLWWYILSLTVTKPKKTCTSWFYWGWEIYCVVLEYSILFPTFAFFQNVFHLPFGDKSLIRFKVANSVQCISLCVI